MGAFGRRILLTAIVATMLGSWVFAQPQSAGQDMKDAGNATKSAGQDVGHATKTTAKKTKRGVKKGTHKAAHKTRQGASKVEDKTTPQ